MQYSEEITNRGVYFNEGILNALLFCYGKMGKMDRAYELLDHLEATGKPLQIDSFVATM